jgi:hypothetical protein
LHASRTGGALQLNVISFDIPREAAVSQGETDSASIDGPINDRSGDVTATEEIRSGTFHRPSEAATFLL